MSTKLLKVGQKFLITTDNWFFAPDGQQFKAVWGTVHAISDSKETLGMETNRYSSNWYIHIGSMVVAGCQIHYAINTNENPCDYKYSKEDIHEGQGL